MNALAKLRAKLPPGLVEVMHVPGLGPKTARKLWSELGVESLDDLRRPPSRSACGLPGLGAKTEEKVLKSPRPAEGLGGDRPHAARQGAAAVRRAEIEASGLADRVCEAGSVRRAARRRRTST